MASVLHLSEAEAAQNFPSVMEKVRQGFEVTIGDASNPVAVVSPAARKRSGRPATEILQRLKERGDPQVHTDEAFAADLEQIVAAREKPWQAPSWD